MNLNHNPLLSMTLLNDDYLLAAAEKVDDLQAELAKFLQSDDHSVIAFRVALRNALQARIKAEARKHALSLRTRGFPTVSSQDIDLAVMKTITGADDIRDTLLAAWEKSDKPDTILAALSIPGWFSTKRIANLAESLVQRAKDLVENRAFDKAPTVTTNQTGFTGRRMWQSASGREGRFGILDGTIVDPGQNFSVPERTVRGRRLRSYKDLPYPRYNPTDVDSFSNNKDKLLYEFITEDGRVEWR